MATRKELIEALRARYSGAPPVEKAKILDEFVALTGYHRKHAIRVLREEAITKETRARNRLYDEAVRQALTVLWEAADRVCGKRLKALIPMLVDAMERHDHLELDPVVKTKVLQVSAATIDRVLADARSHIDGKRRRRTGVGAAIGAAFRCARSPTGGIRRQASSRSIWSNTAAARRPTVTTSTR